MPVGPRAYGTARARIAVPVALPHELRRGFREFVGLVNEEPGNGHASELLASVCNEADRTHTALFLHVDPEPGTDPERLKGLYERNGFGVVQAEPLLMSRVPCGH